MDGGTNPDGGIVGRDAGSPPVPVDGGCSCSLSARRRTIPAGLALLIGLVTWFRRRRR